MTGTERTTETGTRWAVCSLKTVYNGNGSLRRCEVTITDPHETLAEAEESLRVAREVFPEMDWDIIPDTKPRVPRRFLEAAAHAEREKTRR